MVVLTGVSKQSRGFRLIFQGRNCNLMGWMDATEKCCCYIHSFLDSVECYMLHRFAKDRTRPLATHGRRARQYTRHPTWPIIPEL
jgi:hypothetical protein